MKTFHYQKSVGFLICGLLLLGGAVFIAYPFARCAGCWRWAYFKHWWYLYVLPLSAAAAFAVFGLSQILFWARHVLKKPYLTIENGKIDIDAEMMLDMDDIESVKQFNFWGCRMLGLKIANPEKYRFSWRFKADRMFHKDYRAFICVDMVRKDEQSALLDLFKDKTV